MVLEVNNFSIIFFFNEELDVNYVFIYLAKVLSRAGRTLHEVQTHLDREGASDLVVELVINSVNSPSIFGEAVELGIALLEGGNFTIQNSMYNKLLGGDLSQSFFKVCKTKWGPPKAEKLYQTQFVFFFASFGNNKITFRRRITLN